MKRLVAALFIYAFSIANAYADEKPIPRVLIALYDSREESSPRSTQMHRFLEMPANHLGYDLHYYDVNAPLPALGDDVRGIVAWFNSGVEVPDAKTYLTWLESALKAGKKLVIIENAGIGDKYRKDDDIMQRYNRVLSYIGLQDGNGWTSVTYAARMFAIDKEVAGFERQIGPVLPPFGDTHIIPGKAKTHLQMTIKNEQDDTNADIIITSPNGGYITEGYAVFYVVENEQSKISQWFVNPFKFLKLALGDEVMPVPDITTLNGKRIFYSHIDGDGWNNISEITRYQENKIIAAEVIEKEILEPYSDFAITVGVITADIDKNCYGVKDSERVARAIYALPNVEASSHTHSHPLFWQYFANYTPEKEKPLLSRYPEKPKQRASLFESVKDATMGNEWESLPSAHPRDVHQGNDRQLKPGKNDDSEEDILRKYYHTPRSYACGPFNLDDEISGSASTINTLTPPGKKAMLIQWSGDTSPFEEALAKAREAGLYNINGGDSRFDNEYPSYSSVAPIGLRVGRERQIYSSNSNENTYTNLWTGRFFGFRYLQTTVTNTENPIRVRPFNIYYHMYSGEKDASLGALKENMEFARTQNIIPITTSEYAAIANGFYNTQLTRLSESSWKISNSGKLRTLRFDNAAAKSVNFASSYGVLGQNYFQGSLYVSLDSDVENSIINLKENNHSSILPIESIPYLVESRWQIKRLPLVKSLLTFQTHGYGLGTMVWMMPKSGSYLVKAQTLGGKTLFEKQLLTESGGKLTFVMDVSSEPVIVNINETK
jgi:hypothetical protein